MPDLVFEDFDDDMPLHPQTIVPLPLTEGEINNLLNDPPTGQLLQNQPAEQHQAYMPQYTGDPISFNEDQSPDAREEIMLAATKIETIYKYDLIPDVTKVGENLNKMVLLFNQLGLKPSSNIVRIPRINPRSGDVPIGVEIEVEDCVPNYLDKRFGLSGNQDIASDILHSAWWSTGDNSLRNAGKEFVTKTGLLAKDLPDALAILRLYMDAMFSKASWSYRCGTHVHLNVRNFTIEQLMNLCFLYILFEDSLYHISGDRYRNQFCVPIRSSGSSIERLFALLHKKKPTKGAFRSVFHKFKKYMAFNLLPIGRIATGHDTPKPIGTIEFRHHKGESNPIVLVNWVQALLDLHYLAQQVSFQDLKDTIFDLNSVSNYSEFEESVFTNPLPLTREEITKDMYEGSAFLKELFILSGEL